MEKNEVTEAIKTLQTKHSSRTSPTGTRAFYLCKQFLTNIASGILTESNKNIKFIIQTATTPHPLRQPWSGEDRQVKLGSRRFCKSHPAPIGACVSSVLLLITRIMPGRFAITNKTSKFPWKIPLKVHCRGTPPCAETGRWNSLERHCMKPLTYARIVSALPCTY